jgi:hypothetical protein
MYKYADEFGQVAAVAHVSATSAGEGVQTITSTDSLPRSPG